jgi:hypothetical protein
MVSQLSRACPLSAAAVSNELGSMTDGRSYPVILEG